MSNWTSDTRTTTWDTLGWDISSASTVDDALYMAHLDFEVESKPVTYVEPTTGESILMPNYRANVRTSDGMVYGVVTDNYRLVQNAEAFDFVNYIPDLKLSHAGETKKGISYLVGHLPDIQILGETFTPDIIFRNSFGGNCGVQVIIVPVRLVCSNQFNLFFSDCSNFTSLYHRQSVQEKLKEAELIVQNVNRYLVALRSSAETLSNTKLSTEQLEEALKFLFPLKEDISPKQKERVWKRRKELLTRYNYNDNGNFRGSVWGLVNAYTDYITHAAPLRKTKNYEENHFLNTTTHAISLQGLLDAVSVA